MREDLRVGSWIEKMLLNCLDEKNIEQMIYGIMWDIIGFDMQIDVTC